MGNAGFLGKVTQNHPLGKRRTDIGGFFKSGHLYGKNDWAANSRPKPSGQTRGKERGARSPPAFTESKLAAQRFHQVVIAPACVGVFAHFVAVAHHAVFLQRSEEHTSEL